MPNYSGIWTEQAVMQAVGAGNWPGNPGAPTIGTATAGDASASVTFTAPTNNGGSAITSYTVTSSPGSLTGTGASSPVTVSGLTNGTAYTFTVTATNATGTGPASAASNSVTPVAPNYVEQVFSTYVYAGTGSNQTITNGINVSSNGGLVWIKSRSTADYGHVLHDTARGLVYRLMTNNTNAQNTEAGDVASFNSNGFTTGGGAITNDPAQTYVSWTFREQPKFFDVVTYTGNGGTQQNIAHNLQASPGCIIVKRTNSIGDWYVAPMMQSNWNNDYILLNSTAAKVASSDIWQGTSGTSSTTFGVLDGSTVNISGANYVAYLFAASGSGGFGTSGNDNVISCGTYTGTGAINEINLGFEVQWLMTKTTGSGNWHVEDVTRGMTRNYNAPLYPNTSGAEAVGSVFNAYPTATGFGLVAGNGAQNSFGAVYIYIAIRRGLMAVPTDATKVYTSVLNSNFTDGVVIPGQPTVDVGWSKGTSANSMRIYDRLRGSNVGTNYTLYPESTGAEGNEAYWALDQQNGVRVTATIGTIPYVNYFFSRAAGFFDEVCYTGNGGAREINHNLTAVPELMIVKKRSSTGPWNVYVAALGPTSALYLNTTGSTDTTGRWNSANPTSALFSVSSNADVNESGQTYVNYLFATVAGVSKVGSYTGTGALQTINCGFAAGVRFILIKRTDSTGDWYLYNSASGITSGNDPYFLLNSNAAEVTGTNYVDTTAVGFQVTAAAPAGLNASGGTFIFLAIA